MTFRIALLPVLAFLLAAFPAFAALAPVRIGVLAYRGPDEVVASWGKLADGLSEAIPERHFELRPLEGPALRDAVRRGEVDFILTNSTQYVSLAAEFGVRRIATVVLPEALSPERALGSAVVTLAGNTAITELRDLRGLRIAAAADDAFGGFFAGARELQKNDVDLDAGDARLVITGVPMRRALDALRHGDADAAIVRTCLLEQLSRKGQIRLDDFRVISPQPQPEFRCLTSTPLYPDWPLAVTPTVDRKLAKAVTVALLSMPPSDTGVAWDVPADYQSVHNLFQEMMTGPYAHLRTTTVEGIAKRYRPYILLMVALLAGIVIHIIRVEYLVTRRTSELHAAQARARELQREAEHMARLSILGEMSGTLAHELNQPLTTIATYAQGLARHCASGEVNRELVASANREIVGQTERASGVIRRIRAFVKKRVAVREVRPIMETVREATGMFEAMLPDLPPILVESSLPAGTAVEADHLQVQQVLLNLLKNAADATAELPLDRRVISVAIDRHDDVFAVLVADRGPGVPAETLAHLFEPFFTTKPDGLGLGLAICQSIIEAHGGHLRAEPRDPPPGLIFRFTLPDSAP